MFKEISHSSLSMRLKKWIICLLKITILNLYLCEIATKKIDLFKIMISTTCLSVEYVYQFQFW